jgi:hypothetical protein
MVGQLYVSNTKMQFALAIKSFLDKVNVPTAIVEQASSFLHHIYDQFRPTASIEYFIDTVSSGDFKFSDYPIITDALVAVATLSALPLLATGDFKAGYASVFKSVKSTIKNGPFVVVLMGALFRSFKMVSNFLLGDVVPIEPSLLESWFNKSSALLDKGCIQTMIADESNPSAVLNLKLSQLNALLAEGNELLSTKCLDASISPVMRSQVLLVTTRLATLKARIKKYLNATSIRAQPAVVYFVGEPGTSKSMWMQYALKQHAALFGLSDDPIHQHNLRCDDKYWSGFGDGKLYINIDDMQMFNPKTAGIDP